jgi:hypothetical protein
MKISFIVLLGLLLNTHSLFAADKKSNTGLPPGHPAVEQNTATKPQAEVKVGKISKATNGSTVEECFLGKKKLNGKSTSIRGKVVKYNSGIMGKNWLHIKDGTGAEGKNDLVVTTNDTAKIGEVVMVTGKLQFDKDLGSGYFFPVIVEDAKVKVEN